MPAGKRALEEDEIEEEEEEEEEDEEGEEDSDELLGEVVRSGDDVLRFRTYTPVDTGLRKKVMKNAAVTKHCPLDDEVPTQAAAPSSKRDSVVAKFLPAVTNLDLKNMMALKQRVLDKRTKKAIAELMHRTQQQRAAAADDDDDDSDEEETESSESSSDASEPSAQQGARPSVWFT